MTKPLDLITILLMLVGHLSSVTGEHEKSQTESTRVIGGRYADIYSYPYMVSIQTLYSNWGHNCGGSIISAYAVLTACHCLVSTYNPYPVYRHPQYCRVVAGVSFLGNHTGQQAIRARRFVVHPQCGGPQIYNDAGIIVLQRPFRWTQTVRQISFQTFNRAQAKRTLLDMENRRTLCYSPGWGTTKGAHYPSSWYLKVTSAYLMSSQQCANEFCRRVGRNCGTDFYGFNQVCASSSEGIVCNGDSGGPLVCNGYVYGVVSWKWECITGWPHVYSDIAPILDMARPYISQGHKKNQQKHQKGSHK